MEPQTETTNNNTSNVKHAIVMVLGDIGRSPRMQFHALSLLEQGHYVTLVGYSGEGLIPPLEDANSTWTASCRVGKESTLHRGRLFVCRMQPHPPSRSNILSRILYYPLRLISLISCVIYTLWVELPHAPHTNRPVNVILVQNPPSVPTLLLAYLYCLWQRLRRNHRPRFVIDWHNLGFTMFDPPQATTPFLRATFQHSLRILVKRYEHILANLADAHLCVTLAMEGWLGENFNVCGPRIRVLYDKPPLLFCPTEVKDEHELFRRLRLEEHDFLTPWLQDRTLAPERHDLLEETLFTRAFGRHGNGNIESVELRTDRPALLVSSTSWTPDEDFFILLKALEKLHSSMECGGSNFPKILVLVTGKGPQKSQYAPLLQEFNRTHSLVKIHTLWLEAVDYPKLLGCATLGISLHTSTSGLDLPMKVLDMFGCQVPVCAFGFDCLAELVEDKVNGRIFRSGDELAEQLYELLDGYPDSGPGSELEKYRGSVRGMTRWRENWKECAEDLIVGDWD